MKTRHRNGRKFRRPRHSPWAVYYWWDNRHYEEMRRPITDSDAGLLMTGSIGQVEGFRFIEEGAQL